MSFDPESQPAQHTAPSTTDVGPIVTDYRLLKLSREMYGVETYGASAVTLLSRQRTDANVEVYEFSGNEDPYAHLHGLFGTDIADADRVFPRNQSLWHLETAVRTVIEASSTPFEIPLSHVDIPDGSKHIGLMGIPMHVRASSLGRYLTAHNLDNGRHSLNGTLGRVADVLDAAAKNTTPDFDGAPDLSDFVQWAEVFARIKEDVAGNAVFDLRRKIDSIIKRQMQFGCPAPTGEIILEGMHDFKDPRWTQRRTTEQLVAKESLAHLAASYKTTKNPSPIPPVLREIADS